MAEEKQELGLSVSLGDRLLLAIKYDSVQQAEEIIEQMITQIADSREIEEAERSTMRHNILLNTIDNETGETLLHEAAEGENIENIKWLVQEHGLNVMARDYYNNTPAHIAARAGNLDAVFWLAAHGADITATNGDHHTVRDVIVEYHSNTNIIEQWDMHFGTITAETTSNATAHDIDAHHEAFAFDSLLQHTHIIDQSVSQFDGGDQDSGSI